MISGVENKTEIGSRYEESLGKLSERHCLKQRDATCNHGKEGVLGFKFLHLKDFV
jgi:hypothetical protein